MSRANTLLRGILKRTFKPKESISPAVWVERHIRLSPKTSNIAGRYSLRHTPYLKRIYEDFGNPRVRKVVVKKAAQTGLTQLASNILLYYVCNESFPLLMILPSKELAQQFTERSLHPSIDNCDAVKPFLTDNADDLKKTEFLFKSCIARVIGAGSPSKLSSNPAAIVIVDECDKGEDFASQGEAPALELAEDRTISFPNDKRVLILSTPTTETTSIVQAQYLLGSQSKYFVACPHCKAEQVLKFEQIKWSPACKTDDGGWDIDQVERETYYECENAQCLAHLTERDKLGMIREGVWKDTNPKAFPAEIRSYHVSALYSFNITWGAMAKLFLLAKDDVGKLRNFYNSYLGECFQQRAETIRKTDLDSVVKISPRYSRGELISMPDAILMGCDTQGSDFWAAVLALYSDNTASLVDWGRAQTFEDLMTWFRRSYFVQGTQDSFSAVKAVIDMGGNRTEQVKKFCVSSGGLFVPIVGRTEKQGLFAPVRETTFHYQTANIPGLVINDGTFKDMLLIGTIKQANGRLFLPQNIDDELRTHLSGSQLIEKKDSRGRLETVWKDSRNIHLLDCLKYLEGLRYYLEPRLKLARENAEKLRIYKLRPPPPTESEPVDSWN